MNRYYTADVHIETRTLQDFSAHHATSVPAVIYVWNNGEVSSSLDSTLSPFHFLPQKYQEHIPSITSKLQSHNPEVLLAVRFGGDHAVHSDEEDGLDELSSSHGFEYIDGDLGCRRPNGDSTGLSDERSSGNDASTISPACC